MGVLAEDAAGPLELLELLLPHAATMVAATTDMAAINFAFFTLTPQAGSEGWTLRRTPGAPIPSPFHHPRVPQREDCAAARRLLGHDHDD